MKKGYRLNSVNAYANYQIYKYAQANFAPGGQFLGDIGNAVSGLVSRTGKRVGDVAADGLERYGRRVGNKAYQVNNAGQAIVKEGGDNFLSAQKGINNTANNFRNDAELQKKLGWGALGAGGLALGGAGLVGANMFMGGGKPKQPQAY